MKKLLKFIPFVVLPLLLCSCTIHIFDDASNSSNSSSSNSSGTVYPTSLVISGDDQMYVGEDIFLVATYEPEDVTYTTVTWTSSDSSIVKAKSGGKMTAFAEGNVTITASMRGENGGNITATHDLEVLIPTPQSISLNKTSTTISYNKTRKLAASISPSAANQSVTWSSSNNTIASVDSNGLVTAGSTDGSVTITATCVEDSSLTASCTVTVQEVSGTTVMIYMCGADLESSSDNPGYLNSGYAGYASMDLKEILNVSDQPDDVNILVETGGAAHWAISDINANKLQRWEIRDQEMVLKSSLTKANMGLSSTLQSFVEWGINNYPASKYGLIMWNHGGAMDGCCFDENFSDDSLTHDEITTAVSNARTNCSMSDKLEWITYDACLMAVQDIAEYNSENFNYMLSSQESESGYGYDYDAWLPTLYDDPNIDGGELLEVIGHTFMVEEEYYYSRWGVAFDQTQSVLDLSKMSAYKTAFESFASALNTTLGSNSTKISKLSDLIESAQKYGYNENYDCYPYDIFDIEGALNKIKANSYFSGLSTQIEAVKTALVDLVIYEEHGSGTTGCGLNLFCPISQYSYNYSGYPLSNKGPVTHFTNWATVTEKIFNAWYSN